MHVYQDNWEAAAGEMLECDGEPRNVKDSSYAVTFLKSSELLQQRLVYVLADFSTKPRGSNCTSCTALVPVWC